MLCPVCGRAVGDNHRFCEFCGATVPPVREPAPDVWASVQTAVPYERPAQAESPSAYAEAPAVLHDTPPDSEDVPPKVRPVPLFPDIYGNPYRAFAPPSVPPSSPLAEKEPTPERDNFPAASSPYAPASAAVPFTLTSLSDYSAEKEQPAEDPPVKEPETAGSSMNVKVQEGARPLSLAQYLLMELIGLIPLVNVVVFLVLSLRPGDNPNRARLAQAKLLTALFILIALLAGALTVVILISLEIIAPIYIKFPWA